MGGTLMKTRNLICNESNDSLMKGFTVHQHIILRNFWEYYLEKADKHGVAYGYVMGFENEWGNVSMDEIKPYIISTAKGTALDEVMPPEGYHWEDEKVEEIA